MKNILIVDDDQISNYLTNQVLISLGYGNRIHVVHDAKSALSFMKGYNYKKHLFVFLDIHLPDMDAFDFLELSNFNDQNERLEIVVFSSNIAERDMELAKKFGIFNVIQKPITLENLSPFLGMNPAFTLLD